MEGAEEHPCVTEHPWPAPATASTAGSLAPGLGLVLPTQPGSRGQAESKTPLVLSGEEHKATSTNERGRRNYPSEELLGHD